MQQKDIVIGAGIAGLLYAAEFGNSTIIEQNSTEDRNHVMRVDNTDIFIYLKKLKAAGFTKIKKHNRKDNIPLDQDAPYTEGKELLIDDLLESPWKGMQIKTVQWILKQYIEVFVSSVEIIYDVDSSKGKFEFPQKPTYVEEEAHKDNISNPIPGGVFTYDKDGIRYSLPFERLIICEGTRRKTLLNLLSHLEEYKGMSIEEIKAKEIQEYQYRDKNHIVIFFDLISNKNTLKPKFLNYPELKKEEESLHEYYRNNGVLEENLPQTFFTTTSVAQLPTDYTKSTARIHLLPEKNKVAFTGPIPESIKTRQQATSYVLGIIQIKLPGVQLALSQQGEGRIDRFNNLIRKTDNLDEKDRLRDQKAEFQTKIEYLNENRTDILQRKNAKDKRNGQPFTCSLSFIKEPVRLLPNNCLLVVIGDAQRAAYYPYGQGYSNAKQSIMVLKQHGVGIGSRLSDNDVEAINDDMEKNFLEDLRLKYSHNKFALESADKVRSSLEK